MLTSRVFDNLAVKEKRTVEVKVRVFEKVGDFVKRDEDERHFDFDILEEIEIVLDAEMLLDLLIMLVNENSLDAEIFEVIERPLVRVKKRDAEKARLTDSILD
jgi:hypothetical protein